MRPRPSRRRSPTGPDLPRSPSARSWPSSRAPGTSPPCSSYSLSPDGTIAQPLEGGLTTADIDPQALLAGMQVTGHTKACSPTRPCPPRCRPHRRHAGAGRVPPGPQPRRRHPLLRSHRPPGRGGCRPRGRGPRPTVLPARRGGRRHHPPDRLRRPGRTGGGPAPRGSRVRPAGRVDQRDGRQSRPGPGPGAPVPDVRLPRVAHATHLDTRLRRGRTRRRHRRPARRRRPSSAARPGGSSASSRTCSISPASMPTASHWTSGAWTRPSSCARWSADSSPGPPIWASNSVSRRRTRRPAWSRPTATGSARCSPTWSRTPPPSPSAGSR